MRTIAVINQKGGVGKTTVSINLSACLALQQKRTLLVDMDPQGHCATGLAVKEEEIERSMLEVLTAANHDVGFRDIVWQISENFDLAPSTIRLAAIEQEMAATPGKENLLVNRIGELDGRYDFVVIDCPPGVSLLTFNALKAADAVIIPVETGFFSLHGLGKLLETLDVMRTRCGKHIEFHVLANQYDVRTRLAREILVELKRHFTDRLLKTTVNFNTKLKEASSFGQPITEYDKASRGFKDFMDLAGELIEQAAQQPAAQTATAAAAAPAPAAPAPAARSRAPQTVALRPMGESIIQIERSTPIRGDRVLSEAETVEVTHRVQENVKKLAASANAILGHVLGHDMSKADADRRMEEALGVTVTADGVDFIFESPEANSVQIAGDFNNWRPESLPMRRMDGRPRFKAAVPLEPGRYRYRLVIDGRWINDPNNPQVETNPFGELNSVLEIR
jgi:chromosome partitioning protein